MKERANEKGVVIIFALVLMGAVAMIATAFAVLVRTEKKAARNSCLATQAEFAALSGLENAISAIRAANLTYVCCPDGALDPATGTFSAGAGEILSGWHRYFEPGTTDESLLLSDAAKWVWHYKDERYAPEHTSAITHEMRGRVHGPRVGEVVPPEWNVRVGPPMTQASCALNYAVCVVDLDGKLHAQSVQWGEGFSGNRDQVIEECFVPLTSFATGEPGALLDVNPVPRSIREMTAQALPKPSLESELPDWQRNTYDVETCLTPYPYDSEPWQMNINTARTELIGAAISQITSLSDVGDVDLVVDYIVSRRPYASRAELEDALFLATEGENGDAGLVALNWNGAGDKFLAEEEFNDILNSTSGSEFFRLNIWPDEAAIGDGDLSDAGTVSLPSPASQDITIDIVVDNAVLITAPAAVTILQGTTSATFDLAVTDDLQNLESQLAGTVQFSNGSTIVVGTSTAFTAEVSTGDSIKLDADGLWCEVAGVENNESLTLAVDYAGTGGSGLGTVREASMLVRVAGTSSLRTRSDTIRIKEASSGKLALVISPDTAAESDGVLVSVGTVSVPPPVPLEDFTAKLVSSDTTEARVPATVTIPGGVGSAVFDVTVVQDGVVDGDRLVVIKANALDYTTGWDDITVQDVDTGYADLRPCTYDDPDNPGHYWFDGWETHETEVGPAQTGGECTLAPRDDLTWGCEFKFTSRYLHVYSVGLVREVDTDGFVTDRVLARKKLHAVYDAEADRILWFRWNVTERGNIGDFSP